MPYTRWIEGVEPTARGEVQLGEDAIGVGKHPVTVPGTRLEDIDGVPACDQVHPFTVTADEVDVWVEAHRVHG